MLVQSVTPLIRRTVNIINLPFGLRIQLSREQEGGGEENGARCCQSAYGGKYVLLPLLFTLIDYGEAVLSLCVLSITSSLPSLPSRGMGLRRGNFYYSPLLFLLADYGEQYMQIRSGFCPLRVFFITSSISFTCYGSFKRWKCYHAPLFLLMAASGGQYMQILWVFCTVPRSSLPPPLSLGSTFEGKFCHPPSVCPARSHPFPSRTPSLAWEAGR